MIHHFAQKSLCHWICTYTIQVWYMYHTWIVYVQIQDSLYTYYQSQSTLKSLGEEVIYNFTIQAAHVDDWGTFLLARRLLFVSKLSSLIVQGSNKCTLLIHTTVIHNSYGLRWCEESCRQWFVWVGLWYTLEMRKSSKLYLIWIFGSDISFSYFHSCVKWMLWLME